MSFVRYIWKRYRFVRVTSYLLAYCLFSSILPSAMLAGPKGLALGRSKQHGNPHNSSILSSIGTKINPAGITGIVKIKINGTVPNISNKGTVNIQNGSNRHLTASSGKQVFLEKCGSNIFVEINSSGLNGVMGKRSANNGKNSVLVLGSGDAFYEAIGGVGASVGSLVVPDPIGAKGPNPNHGGRHPKKGDGNSGGGKGNGNWGEGNKGNGVGNIWTGNQGYGVGEGMAGGSKPKPDSDPDPDPDPDQDPDVAA